MTPQPEFHWPPVEVFYACFMWTAYLLVVVYFHAKIRRRHPDWTGLAEFFSMLPGMVWLVLGALLGALYFG